jgi:hypothetical protein
MDFGRITPEAVRAKWEEASARCHIDPEGAIVSACRLLETVCRQILDGVNFPYANSANLAALMKAATAQITIAPDLHSEEEYRRVLVGAANVMGNFGSPPATKLLARHAQFAVNMAGAAAMFLAEAWKVQLEEILEDLEDSKGG